MAFKTKDGKMFGNNAMGQRYDESRKPKAKESDGGEHEQEDGASIEDHVAEHGPADHVEIHSHHGGKVHKSTHHDAQSAHEHVSKAFGEEPEENEHQEPDGDEAESMAGEGMPAIPGMR